jgi:hypothetical protein
MTIYLGRRLPDASSGLPGGSGEPPSRRSDTCVPGRRRLPIWPCSGWGLPSSRCRHRDWCALTAPFHPYPARRRGGLLSVALSVGLPPLAVSQHPALRSPDFPPRRPACAVAEAIISSPSMPPLLRRSRARAPGRSPRAECVRPTRNRAPGTWRRPWRRAP